MKVVKISKAEYEKLLAQKKLTVVDPTNKSGQVVKLNAGLQLKHMSASAADSLNKVTEKCSNPTVKSSPSVPEPSSKTRVADPKRIGTIETWIQNQTGTRPVKKPTVKKESTISNMSIKERLRLVNEKIANKNKTSSLRYEVLQPENSKVVNGRMIFNTTAGKSETNSVYGVGNEPMRTKYISPGKRSKFMHPDSYKILQDDDLEQNVIPIVHTGRIYSSKSVDKSMLNPISNKKKAESGDNNPENVNLKRSVNQEETIGKVPPVKRVRFSDEILSKPNIDNFNVSTTPKPCASTSNSSVYDKWKQKAKRTLPKETLDQCSPVSKKQKLDSGIQEEQISDVSTHSTVVHSDKDNKESIPEVNQNHQQNTDGVFEQRESVIEGRCPDSPLREDSMDTQQQEKDPPTFDHLESLEPSSTSTSSHSTSEPSASTENLNQESSSSSLADISSKESDISPKASHDTVEASEVSVSSEVSDNSCKSNKSDGPSKSFNVSGLTSQLAQAMAQKKKLNDPNKEDCSPRNLSPPLLEPEWPVESGSLPNTATAMPTEEGEDDMPVLVPDHMPPTLVEPGKDNIFQRMMNK